MDEKEPLPYDDRNINYDELSEEDYMKEMEKKVEFYKKHYPDMYKKAEDWIKMLDHSEVYKTAQKENNPNDTTIENEPSGVIQARDILKNMNFHGLSEEDITEKDKTVLDEHIPEWRLQLQIE